MACRCSEIAKCERDIVLLGGEVAQKLNNARSNNDSALAKYHALSSSMAGAVSVGNLERVNQRFTAIKKQHDGKLENLQSRRSGELSRIKSRLESYRNEDRRYHEMLAQKAGR
jgi:hypothetical protein